MIGSPLVPDERGVERIASGGGGDHHARVGEDVTGQTDVYRLPTEPDRCAEAVPPVGRADGHGLPDQVSGWIPGGHLVGDDAHQAVCCGNDFRGRALRRIAVGVQDRARRLEALSAVGGASNRHAVTALPPVAGPDHVDVASANGLVCVVADEMSSWDPSGDLVGQAVAVCSTDGGNSFGAPVRLGWESIDISLPGDILANSGVMVAAAPRGDALYAAFVRHQRGANHADIIVRGSYDRGRTWSNPVSATPRDSVVYFQPNLAVDEAGRVAISAFALAHGRVSEVLLLSRPHQLSFGAPLEVTTAPFDPHSQTMTGPKHGAWWIGDYQGITASAGAFHLVWNDTRTGKMDLFAATVRP